MDSVRAEIDLVQTEWDVCARELHAARERVHTQSRVRAVSAELADLDKLLVEQDQWLDLTSDVQTREKAQLRTLSEECQVTIILWPTLVLRDFKTEHQKCKALCMPQYCQYCYSMNMSYVFIAITDTTLGNSPTSIQLSWQNMGVMDVKGIR